MARAFAHKTKQNARTLQTFNWPTQFAGISMSISWLSMVVQPPMDAFPRNCGSSELWLPPHSAGVIAGGCGLGVGSHPSVLLLHTLANLPTHIHSEQKLKKLQNHFCLYSTKIRLHVSLLGVELRTCTVGWSRLPGAHTAQQPLPRCLAFSHTSIHRGHSWRGGALRNGMSRGPKPALGRLQPSQRLRIVQNQKHQLY